MIIELNENSYSVYDDKIYKKSYGVSVLRIGQLHDQIYMHECLLKITNKELQNLDIKNIMIKNLFSEKDTNVKKYIAAQQRELKLINDYRKVLEQYKKFVVLQ